MTRYKSLALIAVTLSLLAGPALALQLGNDRCPEQCSHDGGASSSSSSSGGNGGSGGGSNGGGEGPGNSGGDKPGHGHGDKNHGHSGPPGQNK